MGHVVLDVTCKEKMSFPGDGYKVAVIDLGVKKNIVQLSVEAWLSVTVYPAGHSCRGDHRGCTGRHYADEWSWRSEGQCEDNRGNQEAFCDTKIPIFAICLGHQLDGTCKRCRYTEDEIWTSWRQIIR